MLNQEQKEFVDDIINKVKRKQSGMILLNAPAGTGKTFCIRHLHSQLRCLILTPTHKSAQLFEPIKAKTIHSYFNSLPDIKENGQVVFLETTFCRVCKKKFETKDNEIIFDKKYKHIIECNEDFSEGKQKQVIFVDEASMVCIDMLNLFKDLAKTNLVVFTCDNYQIPPVDYYISPIFQIKNYVSTHTFITSMRQKNDNIKTFCEKFRDAVDNHRNIPVPRTKVDKVISENKSGTDCVLISWTNKNKDYFNRIIRTGLFKTEESDDIAEFYKDEQIVFSGYKNIATDSSLIQSCLYWSKPDPLKKYVNTIDQANDYVMGILKNVISEIPNFHYPDDNYRIYDREEHIPVYHSSDKITVNELSIISIQMPVINKFTMVVEKKVQKTTYYPVRFHCIKNESEIIFLKVIKEDKPTFDKILKQFKNYITMSSNSKKELWALYYKLTNFLNCDLDYKYSITVHKAQGSQWSHVFVNINDIRRNNELSIADRLAYTAVSRAQDICEFL
jgi:hypothetical protein